jgi:hypothetical protein
MESAVLEGRILPTRMYFQLLRILLIFRMRKLVWNFGRSIIEHKLNKQNVELDGWV